MQSRYYNPEMGRFINADGYASTGQGVLGYNMFAYCGNNPIIYSDNSGARCVYTSTLMGGGNGYIYNQNTDEFSNKRFGNSTVSFSGCGAIATYNALLTLGCRPDLDEIIQYYEQSGSLLFGGVAGLPYSAVADYFAEAGYNVAMCADPELFNYCTSQSDASVIWYTWNNSNKMGMHFFHIDSIAGCNRGYNVFSNENSVHYMPSNISDFFSGSNGKYCVIICINRG